MSRPLVSAALSAAITSGKATIAGGGGSDILEGGPQDDTIDARDGNQDTVLCGGGNDTALVDTLDLVSPSCENVQKTPVAGGTNDDHPPTIAWVAPKSGATISGDTPTTLAVNAADDRGVAKVQFYDDTRKVCEDTTAPYACSYRAHGGDVGRDTLIARAVDGAGQTTIVVRTVKVTKFRPRSVSLAARRAGARIRVSGRVKLPRTVTAKRGCTGTLTVTARAGRRVVARRRLSLKGHCAYSIRLRAQRTGKVRLGARFGGNAVMRARSSRSRTV